jgi:hypothetical protein
MAPDAGDQVTKEKETAMAGTRMKTGHADAPAPKPATPEAQAAATGPDAALPAGAPQAPAAGDSAAPVAKADDAKAPMQAVFDQKGNLIGIVDPSAITPVAGAGGGSKDGDAKPDDAAAPDAAAPAADAAPAAPDAPAAAPAADDSDMTPEPPADAGTPSGGTGSDDDDDVAKSGDVITIAQDVLKSVVTGAVTEALETQGAAHQEAIAKMAAGKDEQAEEIQALKARLETVEGMPAAPKVFTNGQVPPADQLRGQDQGAQPVDVAKAAELRETLYKGAATDQAKAFHEMEGLAIAKLKQIRAGGPQSPAAAS